MSCDICTKRRCILHSLRSFTELHHIIQVPLRFHRTRKEYLCQRHKRQRIRLVDNAYVVHNLITTTDFFALPSTADETCPMSDSEHLQHYLLSLATAHKYIARSMTIVSAAHPCHVAVNTSRHSSAIWTFRSTSDVPCSPHCVPIDVHGARICCNRKFSPSDPIRRVYHCQDSPHS